MVRKPALLVAIMALGLLAAPALAVEPETPRAKIKVGTNWRACATVDFGSRIQDTIVGEFTALGVVSGPGTHTIHAARPLLRESATKARACVPGVGMTGNAGQVTYQVLARGADEAVAVVVDCVKIPDASRRCERVRPIPVASDRGVAQAATPSARIRLTRGGGYGACGVVRDRSANVNFTATLTATGYESTVFANGVIVDFDRDTGNPAKPCSQPGFNPDYALLVFTLTWSSGVGTTGTFTRVCGEVAGTMECTPARPPGPEL